MKHFRTAAFTSTLALLAGPALADVTAEQVWADWKSLFENYGMTPSTESETMTGDTLTVTGISLSADVAPEGQMSMRFGDISFRELGNGTVDISMAETMPISMDVTNPDGEEAKINMVMRQPGLKLVASGDDSQTRYDYDAPEVSIGEISIDASDMPEDFSIDFDMIARGNTGFFEVMSGDLRSYDSITETDSLSLEMAFDIPEGDEAGSMAINFEMANMSQETTGQIGQVAMDMPLSDMIAGGMRQQGIATFGPSTYTIVADTPGGAFEVAAAAEGGTLDVSIDEDGISYGGSNATSTMTFASEAMPLPPLSVSIGETAGRVTIPVVPGEDEQDLAMVVKFIDVSVDDMLWNMIDPGESLPRDPATLIIDLGGRVTVSEDFTAPDYAETAAAPPGQINALNVNELVLSIAGAELLGEGQFAFNNDLGMPMPSGTANLSLTGANALMDKLVVMGLLPQEQAMGARMMMGLFARPGEGEDSLVSEIEVKEDGSILANGQRIK